MNKLMLVLALTLLTARAVLAQDTGNAVVGAPSAVEASPTAAPDATESETVPSEPPQPDSGDGTAPVGDAEPAAAASESETPANAERTASGSQTSPTPAPTRSAHTPARGSVYQNVDEEMESEGNLRSKRARNVFIGNMLYIVGDVGSWSAMAMQVAGIVGGNDDLYTAGFGMSIGMGVLRFSGLLTSGISATKLTKTTIADNFKWGYFIAGLVVGASRVAATEALTRTGNGSEGAIIGIFVGSWIVQDLFWILHGVNASRLTKRYRTFGSRRSYAVAPTVDPVNKRYGLSLNLSF